MITSQVFSPPLSNLTSSFPNQFAFSLFVLLDEINHDRIANFDKLIWALVFAFPVKVQYVVSLKTSKQIISEADTSLKTNILHIICLYRLREECKMNICVIKPYMCAVWSAIIFLISRGSVHKVPGHWASLYPSHDSSPKNRNFTDLSRSEWWKYALLNTVNCTAFLYYIICIFTAKTTLIFICSFINRNIKYKNIKILAY